MAADRRVSVVGQGRSRPRRLPLPRLLAPLFWDQRFRSLRWDRDRDFVVRRVLESGDWRSVSWLRDRLGDDGLRAWLCDPRRRRGGLSRRQVRFWELVLEVRLEGLLREGEASPWRS